MMEKEYNGKDNDSVLAFDTLFTTNSIQILKILLPCLPASMQQFLAVMIKYLELQYTIHFCRVRPVSFGGRQMENETLDIKAIYPELKAYLSPADRAQVEQIFQMQQTMQTFQELKPVFDMMQQAMAAQAAANAAEGNTAESNDAAQDGNGFFGSNAAFNNMGSFMNMFRNMNIDALKGMLSPEQQAMFDMFSADT